MKEKFYKYCLISVVLINIWILVGLFWFYQEEPGEFHGLGLGIYYFYSLFYSLFGGVILLFLRIISLFLKKKRIIETNFLYFFAGIFNFNLFILCIAAILLKMLPIDPAFIPFEVMSLVISVIIFADYYNSNLRIKE